MLDVLTGYASEGPAADAADVKMAMDSDSKRGLALAAAAYSSRDDLLQAETIDVRSDSDLQSDLHCADGSGSGSSLTLPARSSAFVEGDAIGAVTLPAFFAPADCEAGSEQPVFKPHEFLPWQLQLVILFRRSVHLHLRRYDIILINLFVTMLVSTFVSMSTWQSLGTSNSSTSRRLPALFFCTIHQGIISSMQGTHSFPLDRAIMLRERAAGTYTVSAYFVAKSFADFCFQLISPVVYSCMVYPIVGFSPGASKFFTFMGFMILTSQAATSISNMISCLCVSIELSTVVGACVYEISRLYGGWFIKPADMLLYQDWRFADALSYIKVCLSLPQFSPFPFPLSLSLSHHLCVALIYTLNPPQHQYSFIGISLNENAGLSIKCVQPARTCAAPCNVNGPCAGETIDKFYGYDDYTIGFCAGILVVFIVGCKFVSYLGLRFIKM